MNERKPAYLLSFVCFIAVFLILYIIAMTETGDVSKRFFIASICMLFPAMGCALAYLIADTKEKRREAVQAFNFEYYRLKKKTRKALEKARESKLSEIAYRQMVDTYRTEFELRATLYGVPREIYKSDFEAMERRIV